MAYATGTATTPTTLLQALVTWLSGRGWTTNAAAVDGSGYKAAMGKSGVFVNLRAAENEQIWNDNAGAGYGLGVYLSSGYSGGGAWHEEAGGPAVSSINYGAGMMLTAGPFVAYHFHDDGADNIVVIVEHTGGIFGAIGFGPKLSQDTHLSTFPWFFGSTSSYKNTHIGGGQLYGTTASNMAEPMATLESSITSQTATAFVKVNSTIQPNANQWISNGVGGAATFGSMGVKLGVPFHAPRDEDDAGLLSNEYPRWGRIFNYGRGVATAYARALVLPIHLFAPDPSTARWIYLGYPPSVFGCDAVGNGWAAGDVLTIGGLDYKLYPRCAVRYIP